MNTQHKQAGLVWDMPVRVFHWSLALSFAGAWLTAERENWQLWHVSFGYSMAILIAFRLLWGVVGTRYARFAQFVRGPGAIKEYFLSYLHGKPQHHVGHNPAGALAIVTIMAVTLVTFASGYATYENIGGDWLSEVHEAAASLLMGLILMHIVAVVLTSVVHKENMVRAMLTGKKLIAPEDAIDYPQIAVALLLLGVLAGLWWLMFQ